MTRDTEIKEAISKVEHPEIAMSLMDLGMISEVSVEGDGASYTLRIPFMGIPDVIRNTMLDSVREAVEGVGGQIIEAKVETMDAQTREAFFSKEQSHWKA